MKRKLSLPLAALMLISSLCMPVYAYEAADFPISINGADPLEMLYGPVVENGTTLVPFRDVLEEMGAEVSWEAESKTVTCTLGDKSVSLSIGSDIITTDNGNVKLDVPAQIIDTKTYVPLRAISEGLGAQVNWDAENKTISIYTSEDTLEESSRTDTDIYMVPSYSIKDYSNSIKSGSTDIVPVTASYPVFKGNGRSAAKLNKYIADDAQGRVNSYKTTNTKRLYDLYQDCIKNGTRSIFKNYSYNVSYEVKTDSNDIISLYVTETISSDKENKVTVSGITLSSKTGNVLTADELYENASDIAKNGFIEKGFPELSVNRLVFDDTSFYIEDGNMIYVVNKGVLSDKIEEFRIDLPDKEPETSNTSSAAVNEVTDEDKLYSQDSGIVMILNTSYPEFAGSSSLSALNSVIAKTQQNAMSSYKEDNRSSALAAYKAFEETKDKKTDRFEPWLWTSDYEVKYNDGQIASIVTSTYIYKGDGSEATTYSAYTCDLKAGKLISVDSLINDTAKTDYAARAAFKALIEKDRLNFYTDVYERFDLSKASKYITADGVTYMFSPGEIASVSQGVIEVTVPLA